jgi:ribosomal protein S18 acetylase RimI-like enzyme
MAGPAAACKLAAMDDAIAIPSALGPLRLRPEGPEDQGFRYRLFCDSRPPEWYRVAIEPDMREALMRHQFAAQTMTYRARFPQARFDIIELAGERIGRIVVNRPGAMVHVVDHAIVPQLRGRGLGTAIMRALMDEAAAAGLPVRLKVADANDPSLRLYLRLGFTPIESVPAYIELEWTGADAEANT